MKTKRKWTLFTGGVWHLHVSGIFRGRVAWSGDGWKWHPIEDNGQPRRTHERLGDAKRAAR